MGFTIDLTYGKCRLWKPCSPHLDLLMKALLDNRYEWWGTVGNQPAHNDDGTTSGPGEWEWCDGSGWFGHHTTPHLPAPLGPCTTLTHTTHGSYWQGESGSEELEKVILLLSLLAPHGSINRMRVKSGSVSEFLWDMFAAGNACCTLYDMSWRQYKVILVVRICLIVGNYRGSKAWM